MTSKETLRRLAGAVAVACMTVWTLVACSTPHVVHLVDGSTIEARNEPEFDEEEEVYVFEDLEGKEIRINRDQVVTVQEK